MRAELSKIQFRILELEESKQLLEGNICEMS